MKAKSKSVKSPKAAKGKVKSKGGKVNKKNDAANANTMNKLINTKTKKPVPNKNGFKAGYRNHPSTQPNGSGFKNEGTIGSFDRNWKQLIQPDGRRWYEFEDPVEEPSDDVKPLTDEEINEIRTKANQYVAKDVAAYANSNVKGPNRNDYLWMNKVMKSGTLSDRMAAFTVRIQDSPIHNCACLQQLIGQVKVQGKKHCLMTTDTLKDLFLQDLLPPDRKLRHFVEHGAALKNATKKNLLLWAFEDRLKSCYNNYIKAINKMASDTVDQMRGKAISVIQELLTSHPEQESVLLQMLVNKLGDPVQKVASRAVFHLKKVIVAHPRMKMVVVDEVERLLFRNNVSKRAQYYGISFLNLVWLQEEHPQLSVKILKVHIGFFKACIKLGEIDSKLMNALLIGVNKSYPKAKIMGIDLSESIDTLYKIVALSQLNISIQALAVLQQMVDVKTEIQKADRFYRVLYEKILHPDVATTSHSMKLLNVTYKALVADTVPARVMAMVKRLLQICHYTPPNIACGILYLISETMKFHRNIFTFSKIAKTDKRNEATANGSTPEQVELEDLPEPERKELEKLAKKSNVKIQPEKSSDETVVVPSTNKPATSSNVKQQQNSTEVDLSVVKTEIRTTCYDPLARNPSYCGANLTLTYELVSLCQHVHPSVALFAQTLIQKNFIKYDGNPLHDFTVARFLERFVYRNAKINKMRQQYAPRGLRSIAVNSADYLQADESAVPVEEKFFYKFFKDREQKPAKPVKIKRKDEDSDVESVGDEEFDDIMANYFKQTGALAGSDEENELDFAADVKTASKKTKRKRGAQADDGESEEEDDDEDDEMDEGVIDEGSDLDDEEAADADEFVEMDDDDLGDEEDIDLDEFGSGSDFDDEEDGAVAGPSKKAKIPSKGKLKKLSKSMFLPAEQFADMLDSNADVDFTGSHTFVNKDNADMKQLKWETERDRWAKGYKKTSKVSFKGQKSKKRKAN